MTRPRLALVTGANRGIGLEVCRQLLASGHRVVLTGRDAARVEAASTSLGGERVAGLVLDVTDERSVERAAAQVRERWGHVDVLINNAGVVLDTKGPWGPAATVSAVPPHTIRATWETNVLGAYRMVQAFVPGMVAEGWGRVVNVSSGMGQLSEMGSMVPGYRMSKAALNALTRTLSAELRGSGVLVNSVCPGWVRTNMGGHGATRSVEEGARGIHWAATLPDDGPQGGFFRDGVALDW
jgi:NAD(P)-dependent dehydrogenase (short-subunit alcohol dehydrogenase family)